MILAAGRGERMRPLTLERPKPLIEVAGKKLIDHAYDALAASGISRLVVNAHHLGAQVEAWAETKTEPTVEVSHETTGLLETGGGVAQALDKLGDAAFFVVNGDTFWIDGPTPALDRVRAAWDDERMDALLLLASFPAAVGFTGLGDFSMDGLGRLRRPLAGHTAPFVFTGVSLLSPRLFARAPRGAFSLNLLFDDAIAAGRLFGLRHDGLWFHVGTPGAICEAEAAYAAAT